MRCPAWKKSLTTATVAGLAALFLLALPLGLQLVPGPHQLALMPRPALWFGTAGAIFAITLVWQLTQGAFSRIRLPIPRLSHRAAAAPLIMVALLLPCVAQRYWLDLGVLVLIYTILGWGLNVIVGLTGLLNLGFAGFYAIGAYSYAIITTRYGLGFWETLPIAVLAAAFGGVCLGLPVLRLRGDYLAIVTLAFGEIMRIVLVNWIDLTGGPNGIGGVARPALPGLAHLHGVGRTRLLYGIALALALAVNAVILHIRRMPLGRAWEALREDEIACRALGINTVSSKLTAFAVSAAIGGLAGALFAAREGFISPESFTFNESALILAIVVMGGLGSQLGVALSALVMIGGSEILRDVAQFRMLIFGLLLVCMINWRPGGLIGKRRPSILMTLRLRAIDA